VHFAILDPHRIWNSPKVFCFFFSKKNCFLTGLPTGNPRPLAFEKLAPGARSAPLSERGPGWKSPCKQ
jgi:hypothetical protein